MVVGAYMLVGRNNMRDIRELIEYENENTSLDFKAIQYKKEIYESFLKDIMSLANANSKEDKFIIIGVKHFPNGKRDLLGIQENFIDEATYLQLIDSNIEPQIDLKYFPIIYDGKTFGIFQIMDCSNPPYMMKKDYGNLKIGDSFIRKGSYQTRLTRKDIDNQIILKKETDISEDVFLSLSESEVIKEIRFDRKEIELPSDITKAKIENIISRRENEIKFESFRNIRFISQSPFSFTKYEDRDLHTLRKNLEEIKEDYKEEDNYYLFEKNAYKLNFYIHNNSHKFLEDVSVEILIDTSENYTIRDSIYKKPEYYNPIMNMNPRMASWEELNYPKIEYKEGKYRMYSEIGNIKHHLPTKTLDVELRLIINNYVIENNIEIAIKIFAKNIKKPIEDSVIINI